MQVLNVRLLLVCGAFFLSFNVARSQNQLGLGIGAGSVRGDFLSSNTSLQNLGPFVQGSYFLQTKKDQFLVGLISNYSTSLQSRSFDTDMLSYTSSIRTHHTFIGLALKTYPASSVRLYNPYPGRVLPFFSVGFGVELFNNTLTNTPPPAGFVLDEGFKTQFTGMLEAGLEVNLTEKLSISGSITWRTAFTDNWDGLIGTGQANDALAAVQLGLVYRLTKEKLF